MFNGNSSITVKAITTESSVISALTDSLQSLGDAQVHENGRISIRATKFDGFACSTSLSGRWKIRNEQIIVEISCQATPDVLAWLIAICFFPLGLAILFIPYNTKSEMMRQIDGALNDAKAGLQNQTSARIPSRMSAPPPPPVLNIPPHPQEVLYYVLIDNANVGPLNTNQIKAEMAAGKVTVNTLCWTEGMSEWKTIASTILL